MAFGSALGRADGATVVLSADTGQFNAKIEAAERQWRESTGAMTREALKLDVAQDRLKKSLASYGAESTQAKRATIALKDAEEGAARATDRLGRELRENERHMGRLTRGALAGSGAMRGLGRSLAFASGSFLSGAGFVYAARSALKASSNLAEQMDFAKRTFEDAFPVVENFANNALGLARDQAYDATAGIGSLLKPLGVLPGVAAKTSVQLSKLAVDFASMKNARLEDVLLAVRSGLVGESEPLRKYAVLLGEARVQQVALAQSGKTNVKELTNTEKVLARVSIIFKDGAQAVGNYKDTIGGAANQEREAQKNFRNTQILIGDTLRPAYTDLLKDVNAYLGSAENQRKIQEKVNSAVETGEKVVRGFAGGLRIVKGAVSPVVGALGGMENTIKAITLLWVGFKVKAGISFVATAVASRVAAIRMAADAAVAGRAWDVATRPRVMSVTTAGAFAPGSRGNPRAPGGGPGRLGRFGRGALAAIGLTPPGAIAIGAITTSIFGIRSGQKDAVDAGEMQKLVQAARQGKLTGSMLEEGREFLTDDQYRTLRLILLKRGGRGGANYTPAPGEVGSKKPPPPSRDPGRDPPRRGLADIELDIARPGNDVGDLQEKRSFIARQIQALERRKNLSAEQKAKLAGLYGELSSVQSQLDAIADEGEQKIEDQRKRAAEAREKKREEAARKREAAERRREAAEEREEKRMAGIRASAAKRAENRRELLAGTGGTREQMRAAALRGMRGAREAKPNAEEKGLTEADFRRMSFEFISSLNGVIGQFEGNTNESGMGQVATHAVAQTSLIREQNQMMGKLVGSMWHPGAAYAGTQLSATGIGSGF